MFKNKNILITGSNKGIGLACVSCFLREGANVIAIVRNVITSSLLDLKNLENSKRLFIYEIDLENENEIKKKIKEIVLKFEAIDVLVNNAGQIFNGLLQMTSKSKLENLFNINFYAPVLLTQLVLKKMIRLKKGNIINISSTSSEDCNFGRSAYSSSKAALETMTKTLAYEIGPYNIRANCILPGLTDTDLMRDNTDKEVIEEVKKKIALRRLAEPKEIAELVKFLASEYSSYITGETIRIDGGMQK